MKQTHNILPKDGEVIFFPDSFSAEESARYFRMLLEETPWKQEPIKMFGKLVMQPRLTAWYGDKNKAYSYSGIMMIPNKWTDSLLQIKEQTEDVAGARFGGALLNLYRHGQDSMGWHSDNEKELGINPVIASVSFGASRTFLLRHRTEQMLKKTLELTNGSLLVMRGETQHYWQHSIPKSSAEAQARINITFRTMAN